MAFGVIFKFSVGRAGWLAKMILGLALYTAQHLPAQAQDQTGLRIVTAEEPPANYLENGELIGTTIDIIREILNRQGLDVKIELRPWPRAFLIAKTTPNVVIFTAGHTQERIDLGFHFIGPIISRKHILWKRRESDFDIRSIDDVVQRRLMISGMREDWRTRLFLAEGAEVSQTSSFPLGLKQLSLGRTDLWISSDIEMPAITRELAIDPGSIEPALVFREAPSFIMLSKGTEQAIIENWRHTFQNMQNSDFFEKAARKWSAILNMDMAYAPEKGFHIAGN
ncbi:substrate-binding periplasmic protein [Aestuariispira insulae]|uniref:Amino acid ABC transporter substrate-binding protein (PAAT family) n=1 Tax=Aestuariispira insulae TaxID=1461337 RepID=A0A3D9HRK4_9PROT|nr:transporter substrate-binding domain-containing protein [Aestuariispira insulae]RED52089.1 amino acid ABC transporter substrate-binding protein (PAAT family) [Aestuariispira insulae]